MRSLSKGLTAAAVVAAIVATTAPARGQGFRPSLRIPSAEKVVEAKKMATDLFAKLKDGKTEEVAQWITREVGYTLSAQEKVKQTGEFKSSLDLLLIGPPDGAYGKLDSYDLMQESYLPGSDRYFRLIYMTYHQASPLLWEFRFYLTPQERVTLHQISWSPMNPFEYLTKPEMLLDQWYGK